MDTTLKRGMTMAESCEYLGNISRPTLYRLLGDGALDSFHIGTRRFIPRESLDRLINDRIGKWPEVDEMVASDATMLRVYHSNKGDLTGGDNGDLR
jgi:excisionase family DNA binding protein